MWKIKKKLIIEKENVVHEDKKVVDEDKTDNNKIKKVDNINNNKNENRDEDDIKLTIIYSNSKKIIELIF